MLQNSFLHLPGVGLRKERQLWAKGLFEWSHMLAPAGPNPLPDSDFLRFRPVLEESRERLAARDAAYFAKRLPAAEHWRLFGEFRNDIGYLDIETTGLGTETDHVTTLSLFGNGRLYTYIFGENLDAFLDDVLQFKVLASYNGKCFDIPFLERQFRTRFCQPHIDLRYVLRSLGYKGGLKGCEQQLGISRNDLDGIDGFWAVLLWQEYERTGDRRALDTLLAYNIEDTVNLERLMVIAYNKKIGEAPLCVPRQEEPPCFEKTVLPHPEVIARIRAARFGMPTPSAGL